MGNAATGALTQRVDIETGITDLANVVNFTGGTVLDGAGDALVSEGGGNQSSCTCAAEVEGGAEGAAGNLAEEGAFIVKDYVSKFTGSANFGVIVAVDAIGDVAVLVADAVGTAGVGGVEGLVLGAAAGRVVDQEGVSGAVAAGS